MAKKVMLRITPPSGDPVKGAADSDMVLTSRPPIDQKLDLRDRLTELVGKGNTLSPDDKAAIYGALTSSLGKDKAMKIMNHAYLFNERPEIKRLPIEERIKSFYNVGSNDPEVNDLISKSRSIGYGVLPGFRESASALNQVLAGRIPGATVTGVDPEVQKRIMLRVNK